YLLEWNIKDITIFAIGVMLFFLLVRRLHYTLSYYDEVLNIYISYTTVAMGKQHLVDNHWIFSMGDLFNIPFVYVLYKITGGVEGIVLFLRYAYLGVNIFLSIIFFSVFHKYLGKSLCVLFSLIFITYAPISIYSIWYDSAGLFFLLAGELLLLGSEMKEDKGTNDRLRFFSGVAHACMVYAYPLMILVILILFLGSSFLKIKEDNMALKKLVAYWLPYIMGGVVILFVFVGYVLNVGWENVYFFQEHALESSLSGRIMGDVLTTAGNMREGSYQEQSTMTLLLGKIGTRVHSILWCMWEQQKKTLWVTIVMLIQWSIGLVYKKMIRLILIPEIILVSFFMHNGTRYWSTTTMYAYYFCWAPFLYFYLENKDKKIGKLLLCILWGTAIAALFSVGFTVAYETKAHMGLYSGAICTFIFMVLLAKEENFAKLNFAPIVVLLIAGCNLMIFYNNVYEGAKVSECNYLMQEGIYKGIMSTEDDVAYEHMAKHLRKLDLEKDATLYVSSDIYTPAYIEGNLLWSIDLLSIESSLQSGEEIAGVYDAKEWPDVIIMGETEREYYPVILKEIIPEQYEMISSEYGYYMYVKDE
ncbi:MAG: hypothetical protein K2P14_11270, partial [Anaeroplasmataceae bacterium]|nr:hypothetical protein [Anaeroplasmataceae bacterium]